MKTKFIICYFTTLLLISSVKSFQHMNKNIELEPMVQRLCFEKKLMLQYGLNEKVVSALIDKKMAEYSKNIARSFPLDESIDITRDDEVGSYGQSINSDIIGTQQAMVTNAITLILDQTNNVNKESDVSELKLSSRPTVNMGRRKEIKRQLPIESSKSDACRRQIQDQFYREFERLDATNTKEIEGPKDHRNENLVTFVENKSNLETKRLRQSAPSNENSSNISVKERTKIDSHGYNVDFLQMGSGNSQNSIQQAIMDE